MPKLTKRTIDQTSESNGQPVNSPEGKGLQKLRSAWERRNTNTIVIGSTDFDHDSEFKAATMSDAIKRIGGVKWLIPDWIPFRMLTEILAEPGKGKSLFALWLAVCLITGRKWFTGGSGFNGPRNVVLIDTEGRFGVNADRLKKWKVPPKAISRIKLPFGGAPLKQVSLTNAEHREKIWDTINKYKTPLVIVDSLRGSHGESENDSRIAQQVLKPLGEIIQDCGPACTVVHHARKLAIDEDISANSSRGSNAILADFVSQIAIDLPDPNSEWRRMQLLKENLGIKPSPIGFRPTPSGLQFGPPPQKPRKPKRQTGKDNAEKWLRARMTPGQWYKAGELVAEAESLGFSPTGTLQRARETLGIVTPDNIRVVNEKLKHSEWRLPLNPEITEPSNNS